MKRNGIGRGIRGRGRRVGAALRSALTRAGDGERTFATQAAAVMMVAGAALIAVTVVLPPAAHGSDLLILGYGAVAGLVGVAAIVRGRAPEPVLGAIAALATILITLATLEAGSGVGADDNQVLYLWVAVYCFWFFSLPHALLQAALIAAADAVLLADLDLAFTAALTRWVVLVATYVTVGLLIAWLHRTLARQHKETERLAVIAERVRIARDLHDAAGHGVTAVSLQAAAGLRFLDRDAEVTREALEEIKRTSRMTLKDLRRLLGALRPADPPSRGFDRVSLADLDSLVEQSVRAGVPVEVQISGKPGSLPAGVDQAAYRIVQEALTNVRKHGGAEARARVRLSYGEEALGVEVTNAGEPPRESYPPGGSGLIGMRERAELFGGTLEAGPLDGGGFRVRAELPIGSGVVDEA